MATEDFDNAVDGWRSNLVRMATNYARMLGTFIVGLWVVRLLLHLDSEAFAVIVLLGAGQSITAILNDMSRRSLVPALAGARQSGPAGFQACYNATLLACCGASVVTAGLFAALAIVVPQFQISTELWAAARWFILAKGIQSCVAIAAAPITNTYIVSGRMAAYNFILFAERMCDLVVALWFVFGQEPASTASTVVQYGISTASLNLILIIVSASYLLLHDRRLVPKPRLATAAAFRSFFRIATANSTMVLANNLYFRTDIILMNFVFGTFGNLVFGVASQFVSNIRVLAMGLVTGLDAVTARIACKSERPELAKFVYRTTQVQGFVVVPLVTFFAIHMSALIDLWIGAQLGDIQALPKIVMMAKLLLIGIAARSIAEAWIAVLAGSNQMRQLSRVSLVAGLLNPCLAGLLFFFLPKKAAFYGAALAYIPLILLVDFVMIPVFLQSRLKVRAVDLYRALLPFVIAALATCPCLLLPSPEGVPRIVWLMAAAGGFAIAYTLVSFRLALKLEERAAVFGFVRRTGRRVWSVKRRSVIHEQPSVRRVDVNRSTCQSAFLEE